MAVFGRTFLISLLCFIVLIGLVIVIFLSFLIIGVNSVPRQLMRGLTGLDDLDRLYADGVTHTYVRIYFGMSSKYLEEITDMDLAKAFLTLS